MEKIDMSRMWIRNGWALALAAGTVMACGDGGGSSADPDPAGSGGQAGNGTGGEGTVEAALSEIYFHGAAETLKVGEAAELMLMAKFDDDTEKDITADAEWTTSDAAIITVEAGKLTGIAPGSADITAKYQGKEFTQSFSIAVPALTGIAVSPQLMELKRGEPEQLTLTGTYDNGDTLPITEGVTWTSSNPDVATIDDTGLVTPLRGGPVQFTATFGDQTVTLDATTTCDYPRYARAIAYGETIPPLFWNDAFKADGSNIDLRMEDVYCDVAYKDVKVFFFIISAGWCTPCTLYAQRLKPEYRFIHEAGGEIAIVETETEDFVPADNAYAQRHIEHIIGDAYAYRIGDKDTQPITDFWHKQSWLNAFPTVVAVRTEDMQVITDSNHSMYYLPLLQIAQDPYADWSNPGPPPFSNHCGPDDDEAGEATNDNADGATPLAPGAFHGGICDEFADFYAIDQAGDWKLEVDFDADLADIDVYVWDRAQNQPLSEGGNIVGSTGSTGHEEFVYRGPQIIAIAGYQGASAPYDIKLTPQ
jgi:hypothetical protein